MLCCTVFHSLPLLIHIEKIVLFLLEQQGILASRIARFGEEHEVSQLEPRLSRIAELREAYRAVGQKLLKLLVFMEVNVVGLLC